MKDLFRTEAIAHAARRIEGEVVVARSLSTSLLSWVSLALLGSVALFISTAPYVRKETVPGWLTTSGGIVRVAAQGDGVVDRLLAVEGQMVAAGQAIAEIRSVTVSSEGATYDSVARGIAERAKAARHLSEAEVAKLSGERVHLTNERASLRLEIAEAQQRLMLQNQRIELARGELERAESVAAQGFMTRRELETRRTALLNAEMEASSARAQLLAQRRQAASVDARLRDIPLEITQRQSQSESANAELDIERIRNNAGAAYVVVSPVAGRVSALPLRAGEAVTPGAVVAAVAVGAEQLHVELYAPSRTSGFIAPGQEVRVALDAYPHQKFGALRGVVDSVSPTLLAPSEVRMPGAAFSEPVLRIRVRLRATTLSAYGRSITPRPGLAASASIILERRTLLEWLLDPLYAAGRGL